MENRRGRVIILCLISADGQEKGDKTVEVKKTSGSHFKLDLVTFSLTGHLVVRNRGFKRC